jgi:hypothetical protein
MDAVYGGRATIGPNNSIVYNDASLGLDHPLKVHALHIQRALDHQLTARDNNPKRRRNVQREPRGRKRKKLNPNRICAHCGNEITGQRLQCIAGQDSHLCPRGICCCCCCCWWWCSLLLMVMLMLLLWCCWCCFRLLFVVCCVCQTTNNKTQIRIFTYVDHVLATSEGLQKQQTTPSLAVASNKE